MMTKEGEDATARQQISPKELAAFVVGWRKNLGWSQAILAEISGLTERTIQRIERGEPSSLDSRRALARAFKFEDIDCFNKPLKPAEEVNREFEEFQEQYLTLDVNIAKTGNQLANLVERMHMYVFEQPEDLPDEVGRIVAIIFDQLKDYGDLHRELSFSAKLDFHTEIGELLKSLNDAGFSVRSAFRNIRGSKGYDWNILYLFIRPHGMEAKKVLVPKRIDGLPVQ
jgi:transcriptional regulator with XRE-family HTH domain